MELFNRKYLQMDIRGIKPKLPVSLRRFKTEISHTISGIGNVMGQRSRALWLSLKLQNFNESGLDFLFRKLQLIRDLNLKLSEAETS